MNDRMIFIIESTRHLPRLLNSLMIAQLKLSGLSLIHLIYWIPAIFLRLLIQNNLAKPNLLSLLRSSQMFHILIGGKILLVCYWLCFIHFKWRIVSNKLLLILNITLIMSFSFTHRARCFALIIVFGFVSIIRFR
jgi:hypothetical protein